MIKYLFIFFTMLIFACQNSTVEIKEKVNPFSEENTHKHKENSLRLNENKKWKVDPDMMNYLTYMKEDVEKFEGETMEDYQELSTDLLINIDLLTANCTMKGEAHDQLHIWLLPYIELVNNFATAETEQDADKYYNEIKKSFKEFDRFFN